MKRTERYEVTEVHDPSINPRVQVGTILRDTYLGKTHTYQLERRGVVTPWVTVRHIGTAEGGES